MKKFKFEIGKRRARDTYTNREASNFVSRWARPPSRNTAEWLNVFSKSPRLAVVDRIASDLANINGRLIRVQEDGTEDEVTNHPFLDFMDSPNPLFEMTSSAIWRLHEIYLMLNGESFFLIEKDEKRRPVELWNVPPHWVKATPYLGSPYYTIISPSGVTKTVPVEDMFVMKQLNPSDPFTRGLGAAESIADEVEIDEYAAKFQKRFFYNDATPPVVFLMPDATTEQRDGFLARWNQKHKGVENSHRAAALSGAVDVKEIGSNDGKNLGFIESRQAMRDAVLEHFGVPREIMGITENSNRATADSAQYIYAKNVLTSRIKSREEAINKQLLPLFGSGLIWRFDPVIPYDKDFNKDTALSAFDAGLITKNEARKLIDLPDVEGGDVYKTTLTDLYLSSDVDPSQVQHTLIQETLSQPIVEEKSRAILDALEASVTRENTVLFENSLSRYFAQQLARIDTSLGTTSKADSTEIFALLSPFLNEDGSLNPKAWEALTELEQVHLLKAISEKLLDWNDEAEKLALLLTPLWKKAYSDGVGISSETYHLYNVMRPEFISSAQLNGGKRIVNICETTREKIADIILSGIEDGLSQLTLRKAIHDEMSTATKARVKLIARQETMTALASGQFDMMKSAGAKVKTWHHRPQKNPRDGSKGPNHVILEGETVDIDSKFSNGLRYPRDPSDPRPEELINCRCYLTYGGF